MAADPLPLLHDADAAAAHPFDAAGAGPWYASRRLWLTAALVATLVVEAAWMARRKDSLALQRQTFAALSNDERRGLAEHWDRFHKLAPDEQRRLRTLHEEIERDAAPDALRTTLARYEAWKSGLSPQQSAQLVGLAPDARVDKIIELDRSSTNLATGALSSDDAKVIVGWLERVLAAKQEQLLSALPESSRRRLESFTGRERILALIMNTAALRGTGAPRLEMIPLEAWNELRAELSPAARQRLDAAESPETRKQLLADWIRQAIWQARPFRDGDGFAPRVGEDEIRRYFEQDLTETERNRLLTLPREEMVGQLRRDYLRSKGLWREPGFGDRRPGEPPPHGDGPPPGGRRMERPPGDRPGERPPGDSPRRPDGAPPPFPKGPREKPPPRDEPADRKPK
jgi:hypothetical protein